jgi:hypothetical protein
MHFSMKNILKNNRNHTPKQTTPKHALIDKIYIQVIYKARD